MRDACGGWGRLEGTRPGTHLRCLPRERSRGVQIRHSREVTGADRADVRNRQEGAG